MKRLFIALGIWLVYQTSFAQNRELCVHRTHQVSNWLRNEQTDSIPAYFDSIMYRALPAASISDSWQSLIINFGTCDSTGKTEIELRGDYLVVSQVLFFNKAKMRLQLTFNSDNKIAGMYVNPNTNQYEIPDYVNTFNFVEYKITFGKAPVILDGMLSIRADAGKLPLVIMLQGSGPQDMDGTYGHNKIYKDLAWGIASQNIAVFRYPKRTSIYGSIFLSGNPKTRYTLDDEYIDDVLMAIDILKKRNDIDSNRIFILGHSQGATAAIIAAQKAGNIRGIISASGSPRRIQDLMCEQLDYLNGYEPPHSPKRIQSDKLKSNLVYSLQPDLLPTAPFDSMPLNIAPSYWIYLNRIDAISTLKSMPDINLLFLQGERDYQVTMLDFKIWKEAFGDNPKARFISYPQLNHMFFKGMARSTPAEYEERHNVDESIIRDVVQWIKNIPE